MATEKTKIADKVFVKANGDESRTACADWASLEFRFAEEGIETVAIKAEDLPENMLLILAGHGLAQKGGDAYAGVVKASKNDDEGRTPGQLAFDNVSGVLEMILEGQWTVERTASGPRTTVILEAIATAFEKKGTALDDEAKAGLAAKLANKVEGVDGKELKEKFMSNPEVKAAYESIMADRAAERARKAAEAAAKAGEDEAGEGEDLNALLG